MGEKNNQIAQLKNKQLRLRKEIKREKRFTPYVLFFFVLLTLAIIFLYDFNIVSLFGNGFNFVVFGVLILVLVSVIYLTRTFFIIKKKNKEIKLINNKLYKLMKL